MEESPVQEFAIRNVLCAVDFNPHDHKTVSWAAQMAAEFGARLTLAHVTAGVEFWGPGGNYVNPRWKRKLCSDASQQIAWRPGNSSKVLFTTGGSDAIEVAIKIARTATGRFKTLSFWDAFHGAGFGSAAVGGEALFRSGRIGPLMPGAEHVARFSSYRCPYGTSSAEESGAACARIIDYVLGREGDVAAFIAEPIRAVPYLPPPGFWKEVRKICDRHGTLLVFDEIPNGFGKTGKMFACEHDGVVPDTWWWERRWVAVFCRLPPRLRGRNSTSAPIMRSVIIRTRKTRSRRAPRSPPSRSSRTRGWSPMREGRRHGAGAAQGDHGEA